MKYFLLGACLLLLKYNVVAQDSLQVNPEAFYKSVAEQFSQARILDIRYGVIGSRDFDSEISGSEVGKGHAEAVQDFSLNINLPIIKKERWKLGYSGNYNFRSYNYTNAEDGNVQADLHYINSSVNVTYFSTLFKKPVIYGARITADASEEMFGRVTGMAFATMVLKRRSSSTLTVGLMGFIDPTTTVPILPTFTYTAPLFGNKWNLDVILPSHVMLRTRLGRTGRISFGTELESTRFYFKSNEIVPYTNNFEYRQTALKSGIMYEYLLKRKLVLTAKAGLLNIFQSRITEKGKRFNQDNALINYEPRPAGYFNLGISFNPF